MSIRYPCQCFWCPRGELKAQKCFNAALQCWTCILKESFSDSLFLNFSLDEIRSRYLDSLSLPFFKLSSSYILPPAHKQSCSLFNQINFCIGAFKASNTFTLLSFLTPLSSFIPLPSLYFLKAFTLPVFLCRSAYTSKLCNLTVSLTSIPTFCSQFILYHLQFTSFGDKNKSPIHLLHSI